jgi:hypothetical protein
MNIKNINTLPKEPTTLDSMTKKEFDSIIEKGLSQAKADQSRPIIDVFADLKQMDME